MKITPDRFAHTNPEEGACVMEMVALLSQDQFSDLPDCTDENIAEVAQQVNDRLLAEDRHLIMSQFDRLFNTRGAVHNKDFRAAFKDYAMSLPVPAEHSVVTRMQQRLRSDSTTGEVTMFDATWWVGIWLGLPNTAEEKVKVLSDVLDIYDRIFERTEVQKQDLKKLLNLLGR